MPTDDCISASVGQNVHFSISSLLALLEFFCCAAEPLIRCLSMPCIDSKKRKNHSKNSKEIIKKKNIQ